jgi:NAD(P)-dependent dehydrogenase (short-subunit alcohol dehydrogenase family)
MELGPLNIRVNAIQPGIVEGDRIRRVFGSKAQVRGVSLQTIQEESMSHASIKEMISPQELADMMVFLASPRGRTISGQAISICGDRSHSPEMARASLPPQRLRVGARARDWWISRFAVRIKAM